MDAETLSVASASSSDSWLDDLQKKYEGKKNCGYGIYYHPAVVNESTLGMTRARHDILLQNIIHKVGYYGPRFTLQPLPWPAELEHDTEALAKDIAQYAPLPPSADKDSSDSDDEDDSDSEEAYAAAGYDCPDDLIYVDFIHGGNPSWHESIRKQCRRLPRLDRPGLDYNSAVLCDRDATQELKTIFDKLRTEFKLFRDRPRVAFVRKKNRFQTDSSLGLFDGILDRVFIVADPYSAFSWWDCYWSNHSWMWVVDPNFEADRDVNTNGLTEQYQGYLRVHLQSICDGFLRNLLFHPEISLQQMWEAARRNELRAFTSMRAGRAV